MSSVASRVVEGNPEDDLTIAASMVFGIPLVPTDAIAVLPTGMGEPWRVCDAINLWQESRASAGYRFLLIPGNNPDEPFTKDHTLVTLTRPPYNLRKTRGVVLTQYAQHTPEQCEWILERALERSVDSITLCGPQYHLFRGYLTFVRAMIRVKVRIPLIPRPTPVSPQAITAMTKVSAWEMARAEPERIREYRPRDVATYLELREYLNWLWEQPPLAEISGRLLTR
ncbi:MAG: hypothetical protein AAB871_02725 [Patescibacteria group bacterium]